MSDSKRDTVDAAGEAEDSSGRSGNVPDSRIGFSIAFRYLGTVAAQSTVLAALLFYFGWVRTKATLGYFGITGDLAEISATEYVLRSVRLTFKVLITTGVIALIALFVHSAILAPFLAGREVIIKAIRICAITVGLLAFCTGYFLYVTNYTKNVQFLPILLAVGVILVGCAMPSWVWARSGATTGRAILIAFLFLMAFWAVASYAPKLGWQTALETRRDLRTRVDVFSDKSLDLTGPGVTYSLLPTGGRFRYRYTGMLLLLYSHKRYFLLPDGWKRRRDPVYLLEEGPGVRVEFRAR
ncbi:hypothetical protein [Streptosporangium sp. LJ11]|uniref:hypothetical protein n=1 Tax=Streptosporangium sp. LJ11 TaxID=3436927 RepID=UPI003F7A206F